MEINKNLQRERGGGGVFESLSREGHDVRSQVITSASWISRREMHAGAREAKTSRQRTGSADGRCMQELEKPRHHVSELGQPTGDACRS